MNLSPQKSKTIHDYRQNHWQAHTERANSPSRARSKPSSAPDTKGCNWGTLPANGALLLDFGGPEGWVVFTVTPDKFFNCSLQVVQLLGK